MTRTYMTGYAGSTKTEGGLLAWGVWSRFDPEFARRLKLLMDASIDAGHLCGVGGGWRSTDGQRNLFLSRYHPEDDSDLSGDTYWRYTLPTPMYGKAAGTVVEYWERNAGAAPAAPPLRSFHESTTRLGHCLAADMVGDLRFILAHAANYGLLHFGNINGEPWHLQPSEIPHSRRNYNPALHEPLKPPSVTVPPPPPPAKPIVVVPVPTQRLTYPAMSGKNVMVLQQTWGFWGWYRGKADGYYGPVTTDATKAMQRALKITVDGVYGPQSAAAYKKFAETMANIAAGQA